MTTSNLKISDLKPNQTVEMLLLVRRRNLARSRNGKDYLNLKLGDSSGEITGFMWDGAEAAATAVAEGDCVLVRGRTQIFNNALQLTVTTLKPWTGEIDPRRFLPHTEQHVPTMERELHQLIADLKDPWLCRLVEAFFLKDKEFARKFSLAPAAKAMHHAWLGGLLEHTLGVARLAARVCDLYPGINADLVMAGALLHDIGKVDELVYERGLDYSTSGRLLGHVMLGVRMIQEKAAQIKGFPPETMMLLEHLILSHHGEYAYGSPKRPKTREAILLNFIDDLDAKLVAVDRFMARAGREGAEWSDYHRLFERNFYLGRPAVEAVAPEPEDGADPAAGPGLLF